MNSLKSGLKWTSVSTVLLTILGLAKLSILARFLAAADFGLMALVMFFLGLLEKFVDLGVSSAIYHFKDISDKEYSSLYWFNYIVSFFLYSILYILSPFIAEFYNQPELDVILKVAGSVLIISNIGRQFKIIELKRMNFDAVAKIDIISTIFGFISAVLLSIYGYGVYSLVFSLIIQSLLANLTFLKIGFNRFNLKLFFRFYLLRKFLNIGVYKLGSELLNFFGKDLDVMIIGKLFSPELLGGYSLMKNLARRPLQVIDGTINKITLPLMAKLQNNNKIMVEVFKNIIRLLSSINSLVYGLLVLYSTIIIDLFYGEKFSSFVDVFRVYLIIVALRSIYGQSSVLITAFGKTSIDFYFNIFTTILSAVFIIFFSKFGLIGISLGLLILQLILLFPNWKLFIDKLLNIKFLSYIIGFIPNYFLTIVSIGSFLFCKNLYALVIFSICFVSFFIISVKRDLKLISNLSMNE